MVRYLPTLALVSGLILLAPGCGRESVPPGKTTVEVKKAEGHHEHKPGAHGGNIAEIGRDNYHAEAVFEKGGVLRIFTLDNDESKVLAVERQDLNAFARAEGADDAVPVVLKPEPQPGDGPDKTSQFAGKLPKELAGKAVQVTIPITIQGERFRFVVKSAKIDHEESEMPAKVGHEEEQGLYLTPGGLYTEADIRANGGKTASQRFKGLKSQHNARTQPGDKICPISETKANPKFSWVVGGKTYEFCCPPCVDEFLKTAKERPEEIKSPEAYRK